MLANPLTQLFAVERDRLGRVPVDEFMRVRGIANVFAAADVAWAMMDDRHVSVMSCQHGRPMGRFAGHNVVSDLFGLPMLPLHLAWYVTVLDLGPWPTNTFERTAGSHSPAAAGQRERWTIRNPQ